MFHDKSINKLVIIVLKSSYTCNVIIFIENWFILTGTSWLPTSQENVLGR